MTKLELRLLTEKITHNGIERKRYTIGDYLVGVEYLDGELLYIHVSNTDDRYEPSIYFYNNEESNKKGEFKIQTRVQSELSVDEVYKAINGYQKALEVVRVLTDTFLK